MVRKGSLSPPVPGNLAPPKYGPPGPIFLGNMAPRGSYFLGNLAPLSEICPPPGTIFPRKFGLPFGNLAPLYKHGC